MIGPFLTSSLTTPLDLAKLNFMMILVSLTYFPILHIFNSIQLSFNQKK
jgi:hypothetical protein